MPTDGLHIKRSVSDTGLSHSKMATFMKCGKTRGNNVESKEITTEDLTTGGAELVAVTH